MPIRIFVALAIMPLFLQGAAPPIHTLPRFPSAQVLHDGDMVFRVGRGVAADAVLAAREEYSHVGLIVIRNAQTWVLHAASPEDKGLYNQVVLEPLAVFASPTFSRRVVIYQYYNRALATHAAQIARPWLGRPFDNDFDDREEKALYCTELVWLAYYKAGLNWMPRHHNLPLTPPQGAMLPGDLLKAAHWTQLYDSQLY